MNKGDDVNGKAWIYNMVGGLLLALVVVAFFTGRGNSEGWRSEIARAEENLALAQDGEREARAALESAESRSADLKAVNLAAARQIDRISEYNRELAERNSALEQRLDILASSVDNSGELIDRGLRLLDELAAESTSGDLDE